MSLVHTLGFGYASRTEGGTWRGTVGRDSFKMCYIKEGWFNSRMFPIITGIITPDGTGSRIKMTVRMPWVFYVGLVLIPLVEMMSTQVRSLPHLWQGVVFIVLFVIVAMLYAAYDLTRAKRRFVGLLGQ